MFGNHLVLDLSIGRFGNDISPNQIGLLAIRPIIDDPLGIGFADPGQTYQLSLTRRIQIDQLSIGFVGVDGAARIPSLITIDRASATGKEESGDEDQDDESGCSH